MSDDSPTTYLTEQRRTSVTPPSTYSEGGVGNDPETVMERNRLTSPDILTTNKDLYFTTTFQFFKYDKDVVYDIKNDRAAEYVSRKEKEAAPTGRTRTGGGSLIGGRNAAAAPAFVPTPTKRSGRFQSQVPVVPAPVQTTNEIAREARANILRSPLTTLELPIPTNLVERFAIEYENSQLNLTGKTIADMFVGGKFRGIGDESVDRAITEAVSNIQQNLPPSVDNAITVFRGAVKNPVYSAVFRGIQLRQHQFSWRIIPESADESDALEKIVNKLRFHSLPPFENAGEIDLLQYPDFCMIQLHPEVYRFPKPCFIESITFTRSDGAPAFYKDDKPVVCNIEMTVIETTALSRNDFFDNVETPPA